MKNKKIGKKIYYFFILIIQKKNKIKGNNY
jgi:hypothetical protein